jgi:hypothetical protein
MRRRRRGGTQFHEPSLVPMADMLTNTVGVVLFILIFTVLTAGGAVLTKRLPLERPTKAKPMRFLCVHGRIAPLNDDAAIEEFLRPMGRSVTDEFVSRFKQRHVETPEYVLTGEVGHGLVIIFHPKPGVGETPNDLALPSSHFRAALAAANPRDQYVKFLIMPDGVTAFRAAREIASNGQFGTGWMLFGEEEGLRMCVGFCGPGGPDVVK